MRGNKSRQKGIAAVFLALAIVLGVVYAVKISNFDAQTSPVNLTFTGAQNQTLNITIYNSANVTSAFMNLSGYTLPQNLNSNATDRDSYVGFLLNSTGSLTGPKEYCSNLTLPTASRINITFNVAYNGAVWTSCGSVFPGINITIRNLANANILEELYDIDRTNSVISNNVYSSGKYAFCVKHVNLTSCFAFEVGSLYPKIYQGYTISGGSITNFYPYFNITPTNIFYNVTNPSISVNQTHIWNYTGIFNQTNNKTSDFSQTLNRSLNNGACDCFGCSLNGNKCTINFTFHSDTAGILQVSDLNINWLEYVKPNLTISDPNRTYNGITNVPLNFYAVDNWMLDRCWYNVTRGASLEIANTNIANCLNTTFIVSGDASYVLHMCINDTSGNQNCSDSSFKTTNYIPPSSTGGGGGGKFIIATSEKNRTYFSCKSFAFHFNKNWEENAPFVTIWRSFWDYILCLQAASIIPFPNIPLTEQQIEEIQSPK